MDDKLSAKLQARHQNEVVAIRDLVQERLGEIDLTKAGRFNAASFYAGTSGIRITDVSAFMAEWKAALKAAWREYERAASAPSEVAAYDRYLGGPSSMAYIAVEYIAWPSSEGHSRHGEYVAARGHLWKVLHCEHLTRSGA
jgi:hypothetical protein